MREAQVPSTAGGAILYDAALGVAPDDTWFEREHWTAAGRAETASGGRGGVAFVETPAGACALRHYHRGGWAARLSRDRYVWTGAERTRAFREFRLLARLAERGLPVAAPVAARYVRHGAAYRADLLTRRVVAAHTLAQRLAERRLGGALAHRVGGTIARFHAAQVWHADLNAHNVLVDADDAVWLIDFDRGRVRAPNAAWRRANLRRLRRSLDKLGARAVADFDAQFWRPLLAAYDDAFAQGAPQEIPRGALS